MEADRRLSAVIPDCVIRPAEPSDADWIAALDNAVSHSPWSLDSWTQTIRDSRCWVVLVNGAPAGFIACSLVIDEAEILNIIIDPDRQGSGLGRRLLDHALVSLAEAGAHRCFLEVRRSNEPAIRLYEKRGFEQTGVRKGYYASADGREDAVLYTLKLVEPD